MLFTVMHLHLSMTEFTLAQDYPVLKSLTRKYCPPSFKNIKKSIRDYLISKNVFLIDSEA